jgi:hypothetical protein
MKALWSAIDLSPGIVEQKTTELNCLTPAGTVQRLQLLHIVGVGNRVKKHKSTTD